MCLFPHLLRLHRSQESKRTYLISGFRVWSESLVVFSTFYSSLSALHYFLCFQWERVARIAYENEPKKNECNLNFMRLSVVYALAVFFSVSFSTSFVIVTENSLNIHFLLTQYNSKKKKREKSTTWFCLSSDQTPFVWLCALRVGLNLMRFISFFHSPVEAVETDSMAIFFSLCIVHFPLEV